MWASPVRKGAPRQLLFREDSQVPEQDQEQQQDQETRSLRARINVRESASRLMPLLACIIYWQGKETHDVYS